MSYISSYKKRVGLGAKDRKERLVKKQIKNFDRFMNNSLTGVTLDFTFPNSIDLINTQKINCIVNDVTNNDKKAGDEKIVLVHRDENIQTGCYFYMDNFWWILNFEEHKEIPIYRKFIAKKCNNIIKHKYKNKIYDIPCAVLSLTIYSDGLQTLKHTELLDGKRQVTVGKSEITNSLSLGKIRIMFSDGKVFYITHIDDYVYTGINTYICQETVRVNNDDLNNLVAYNEILEITEVKEETISGKIIGKDELRLASNSTYKIDKSVEWIIECDNVEVIKSIEKTDKQLLLKITTDSRFVGKTFTIKALDIKTNKLLDKKTVKIKNLL